MFTACIQICCDFGQWTVVGGGIKVHKGGTSVFVGFWVSMTGVFGFCTLRSGACIIGKNRYVG